MGNKTVIPSQSSQAEEIGVFLSIMRTPGITDRFLIVPIRNLALRVLSKMKLASLTQNIWKETGHSLASL